MFTGGFGITHLGFDLFGIDHRDDRIHAHELLELGDIEESLGDRTGIGDAGGFDEKIIEAAFFEEILDAFDEVFANRAAEATVGHFEDFVFGGLDEAPIDADFSDLVDDDSELIVVLLFEDVVEESGFSCAEEAGEDGYGYGFHRGIRLVWLRKLREGVLLRRS